MAVGLLATVTVPMAIARHNFNRDLSAYIESTGMFVMLLADVF